MKPIWTHTVKQSTKAAAVVAISTALIIGCSAKPAAAPAGAAAAEAQVVSVKVANIEKKTISAPLEQVADVVSSLQIDIITKAGGDVQEILKKRGDSVTKGEVLFTLDPADVLLQKERAQIAVSGTKQQMDKGRQDLGDGKQELKNGIAKLELALKESTVNYNKMRNDYDSGIAAKSQLQQAENQMNMQKVDLENSKSKLGTMERTNSLVQLEQALQNANLSIREADRTLDNLQVKASASGVLTDLPIQAGMTLPPGFKAAQVQALDPIKVKAELTEDAAALIRGRQELSFYIPGVIQPTKAKVSYLADVMSGSSKSYALELEYPNGDRKLKPGMKAQVLLGEEADQVVVTVPSLSVVREGSETFAFVLKGEQVEKRKIALGRLNETFQEVVSGVKEGEQLVVSGQHQLKDGQKVKVAK